jgi:hypothetical protein
VNLHGEGIDESDTCLCDRVLLLGVNDSYNVGLSDARADRKASQFSETISWINELNYCEAKEHMLGNSAFCMFMCRHHTHSARTLLIHGPCQI